MQQTVLQRVALLKTMDMAAVHENGLNFSAQTAEVQETFLVRWLAWRIQEMYLGGLSERSKTALTQLMESDPVACARESIPSQPKPKVVTVTGTRFVRVWKGSLRVEIMATAELAGAAGNGLLGYWSCKKQLFKLFDPEDSTFIQIFNSHFHMYRNNKGKGHDFMVLSEPKKIDYLPRFEYVTKL